MSWSVRAREKAPRTRVACNALGLREINCAASTKVVPEAPQEIQRERRSADKNYTLIPTFDADVARPRTENTNFVIAPGGDGRLLRRGAAGRSPAGRRGGTSSADVYVDCYARPAADRRPGHDSRNCQSV